MQVVMQRALRDANARAKAMLIAAYMAAPNNMSLQDATAASDQAVLTRSFLRLEQPLTAGPTLFNFPVLTNQNGAGAATRATERRLNPQDAFFVTDIVFYLAKATSATDASFQVYTYPSPTIFTNGAAAGALYTMYNGQMRITINQSVIVPGFDMMGFLQKPQTQLTAATNSPLDQFDGTGVVFFEPMVNLIGTKNNAFVIEIPATMGALDTFTYGVILLRGVLAQNVTLMS